MILAVSSAPAELVDRALRAAEAAGVAMKVMPSVREVVGAVGHPAAVRQAREPRIEDLLGRQQVATDLAAVHRSLADRRILITGAGGSIGSEIALQVAAFGPATVILLDHDETHLHDAAGVLTCPHELALVDVANRSAVFEAFERYQPDVVFHAAAHKHVPVLEAHPVEASSTNVFGTKNVVDAVRGDRSGAVRVHLDRQGRPAVERDGCFEMARGADHACRSLRRMPLTARCVSATSSEAAAASSPPSPGRSPWEVRVTVTDPRMTRYFMSVREAVQLVLQASVLSVGGEIFMLEMGEPVRILDLAQRMIRLSGLSPGHRHPDPNHRCPTRREDRRGAPHPRRGDPPDVSRVGPSPGSDSDRSRHARRHLARSRRGDREEREHHGQGPPVLAIGHEVAKRPSMTDTSTWATAVAAYGLGPPQDVLTEDPVEDSSWPRLLEMARGQRLLGLVRAAAQDGVLALRGEASGTDSRASSTK